MSHILIEQKPVFSKGILHTYYKFKIAEMFSDTVQGEGINIGCPSTFIRLQGCTLVCQWCDTLDVWDKGNEYSFDELLKILDANNVIAKLKSGQHLIFTGGSPLKQQLQIRQFLLEIWSRFGFLPYSEVENETVLPVTHLKEEMLIQCWNNSPKLANSGMKEKVRYKPDVIKATSLLHNSWFKFVVEKGDDWQEIDEYFLQPELIRRNQVILMPQGQTQEELNKIRPIVAEMAVKHQVRFSDRLHITIWNQATGV